MTEEKYKTAIILYRKMSFVLNVRFVILGDSKVSPVFCQKYAVRIFQSTKQLIFLQGTPLMYGTTELIHEADPQSRLVVIIVLHMSSVRTSVRTSVPTFQNKTNFKRNNVRYWRDYRSGRVDH